MIQKRNRKSVLAVIGIVVIGAILGFIIFVTSGTDKRAEKRLNELGKKFYDYYYVEQSDKDDKTKIATFLEKYKETGLTIRLKDLKIYLDNHKVENYKALEKCDEEKTKVTIYPISPYGKKDRTIKTTLKCNFK